MQDSSAKGFIGTTTTVAGTIVAWLPTVNICVQIIAGLIAIVAGIATARYYTRKLKELDK